MRFLHNHSQFTALIDFKAILERKLSMHPDMKNSLDSIGSISTLSKKLQKFLTSEDFPEDFKYSSVTIDEDKPNLIILTDDNGKSRTVKIGKFLKSVNFEFKDWEIEEYINSLKESETDNMKVVSGQDIIKYYKESNKSGNFYSCMSDDSRADKFLGIYANNPDKVRLLVYTDENDYTLGRALLWNLDDTSVAMDRIYAGNEIKPKFYTYAKENNILNGIPSNSTVTLSNKGEYDYYPYMDTMVYYNPDDGVLTNQNMSGDEEWLTLKSTDGSCTRGNTVYSNYLEEDIAEDESFYDEYLDSYVYEVDTVVSVESGNRYHKDNMLKIWLASPDTYSYNAFDADMYVHKELDTDSYTQLDDDIYAEHILYNVDIVHSSDDNEVKIVANTEFHKPWVLNMLSNNVSDMFAYKNDEDEALCVDDAYVTIDEDGEPNYHNEEEFDQLNRDEYDYVSLFKPVYIEDASFLIFSSIFIHTDSPLRYSPIDNDLISYSKDEGFEIAEDIYEYEKNIKYYKKVKGGYLQQYNFTSADMNKISDLIPFLEKYNKGKLKPLPSVEAIIYQYRNKYGKNTNEYEAFVQAIKYNPVYFEYKKHKLVPMCEEGYVFEITHSGINKVVMKNMEDHLE